MPCANNEPTRRCELCGRRVPARLITQHHLTPRQRGGKPEHCVPLCHPCHKQIHALFDNKELAARFSDLALLRRAPELQKFIRWIRKQPPTSNVTTRMSNAHPEARRRQGRNGARSRDACVASSAKPATGDAGVAAT